MKVRLLLVLVAALGFTASLVPGAAGAAAPVRDSLLSTRSESYYRLDVAAASVRVRVEAEFVGQPGKHEQKTVHFWAIPGARNVTAKQGDNYLSTAVASAGAQDGFVTLITATLAEPMRGQIKTSLVLNYELSAQRNDSGQIAAGLAELMLVSQGPGSFVVADVPARAENVLDPGCLKALEQPNDVKAAGFERWICGEVTIAALASDDTTVQKWCANMDERCRQQRLGSPFSAFVQSVTEGNSRGTLDAEIPMANGPVKMTIRFFQSDRAWAERQFKVAQAAFPKLERLFGFPYARDSVRLLESHHVEFVGAAGVAFPTLGQVLISPVTDASWSEEVTVHELAHQWAGHGLEASWQWEGLAEWAMRAVAPELGFTPADRGWAHKPYSDPLSGWYNGSPVPDADYWYGKAGAFWSTYEEAIGGRQNMTAVLALTAPKKGRAPIDGRWFMDTGERASGANLDALFLQWVWSAESAKALLIQRRAAQGTLKPLMDRSAALVSPGYPADIQANLDEWRFDPVPGQVREAQKVLDSYRAVRALAAEAGLTLNQAVATGWTDRTVAASASAVENERQAIIAITTATAELATQAPGSPPVETLARARTKFTAGDLDGAKNLASEAVSRARNQASAIKMIASATKLQAAGGPSFMGSIGLMFSDPDGDLTAANGALARGEPAKARELAQAAYEAWDGAGARGLLRLSIVAGLVFLVALGAWALRERAFRAARRERQLAAREAARRVQPEYSWRNYQ